MSFKPYLSYNFRDKDPVIDELRTLVQDSGESYKKLHDASGVSVSCMYNWFDGPTMRPSHAAVAAVAGALGYKFALVNGGGSPRLINPRPKRSRKVTP